MKYIVVVQKVHDKGEADERMKVLHNVPEVLKYVSQLGQVVGDPRELERIFSVDERGNVTHYEVVFKGCLKLEAQPTVIEA